MMGGASWPEPLYPEAAQGLAACTLLFFFTLAYRCPDGMSPSASRGVVLLYLCRTVSPHVGQHLVELAGLQVRLKALN